MKIEEGVISLTFTCCQYVFLFWLEFAVCLPLPPRNIFFITWVYVENSGCSIDYFFTQSAGVVFFLALLRTGVGLLKPPFNIWPPIQSYRRFPTFIWENFKLIVTCHGVNIDITIITEVWQPCLSKFAFFYKSQFIDIFTYYNNYISLNLAFQWL